MAIGVVYPGQGSQQPGMGKFLFDEFSVARATFEEASEAIHVDLKKLCFDGPESDLNLTHNTQPALLTVSVATYRVLSEIAPLKPGAAAGHSIGEYAAVVNARALDLADATMAVRKRGEAMQSAVPVGQGAMAAVMGLDEVQIRALCAWVNETSGVGPLEPANFNSPGQIVVSGTAKAVQWLGENFTSTSFAGAPSRLKMIPLKVSAPFHCSMMAPAESTMAEVLGGIKFRNADYPVIQNVSAEAVQDGGKLRENLVRQVSAPVRWVDCVLGLKSRGIHQLIESGCGRVLAGLVKKIDGESFQVFGMNSLEDLKTVEAQLQIASSQL